MPSPISVNIYCPKPKLIYFARKIFGAEPCLLPKRNHFSKLLNILVAPAPEDWRPVHYGESNLCIMLPWYEDKNVLRHYYLSPLKQKVFVGRLNDYFQITFRAHVDKYLLRDVPQQQAIYLFMEEYDLPVDVISDLLKDYQRYRSAIRQRKFYQRHKKKASFDEKSCQ